MDLVTEWKLAAEARAWKLLGQPKGCANGRLASISPAIRFGAEVAVIVGQELIPFTYAIDADASNAKLTWFVSAMVIQFSIQKNHMLKNAVLEHLIVSVHESKAIPEYEMPYGIYPAETNLYYVEIGSNRGSIPREFRPTRFYHQATDSQNERWEFPPPIVLDDDLPAHLALRLNAESPGMFLVSIDATIAAGAEREILPVMPPQWMIFQKRADDYDPNFVA